MASKRHWTALFKRNSPTPTPTPTPTHQGNVVTVQRNEETKSRWIPKRQQIDILESIFNSGKLNPTTHEIQAIKTELQQFGEVGDANIFYWFQNRKSRSKMKRQRRLDRAPAPAAAVAENAINRNGSSSSNSTSTHNNIASSITMGSESESSSSAALFPHRDQIPYPRTDQYMNMQEAISYPPSSSEDADLLTVFIDGVKYQVARGPVNLKASFGENAFLVDSSWKQILTNQAGFTFQSLQHGATYHLLKKAFLEV